MKKISRETVNSHIIKQLDKIGYEQFYLDFENRTEKDYTAEYKIDGYNFMTEFTVLIPEKEFESITIEKEFHGKRGSLESEFKALYRSNQSKTLDELFEEWIKHFKNWLYEN